MGYLNKVMLIGRLGQDPELKAVGDSHVCEFSVATTETWKNKQGEKQEKTEWSKVVFWGKQAEVIAQYFNKGSQIMVEGSLDTETWEKEGQKHYTTKIKGQRFLFMDSKSDGGQTSGGGEPQGGGDPKIDDSEIPF